MKWYKINLIRSVHLTLAYIKNCLWLFQQQKHSGVPHNFIRVNFWALFFVSVIWILVAAIDLQQCVWSLQRLLAMLFKKEDERMRCFKSLCDLFYLPNANVHRFKCFYLCMCVLKGLLAHMFASRQAGTEDVSFFSRVLSPGRCVRIDDGAGVSIAGLASNTRVVVRAGVRSSLPEIGA